MMEGENVESFDHNLSTHHYPRQRILPDPSSGACAAALKALTILSDISSKP
jgi:hypothetical protein